MAEEPRDDSKFDVSDLETTAPETPKARKKHASKAESMPVQKAVGEARPLPGVHERPKKQGRKLSSGGKLNAAVAGEIASEAQPGKSEVDEAMETLRDISKEREKEREDAEWDAKIAEAKKKADEEGQVIEFEAEPQSEAEREAEEAQKAAEARAERISKMGERVDAAMAEDDRKETEVEDAWFKKGEEEEMAAIRAGIEAHGNAPLIETPAEIDANVKQAEAMIASGRLNKELFNVDIYRGLLEKKAQIDAELEVAGWWKARLLRKELKEVAADVSNFEEQIQHVMAENNPSGALTAREKEDIRYKGPMAKPAMPKGSGTTIHKAGFFSRLFGKK